ncbi:MAG: hypothetical protein V4677_18210 [Bacteroidota bacterium]
MKKSVLMIAMAFGVSTAFAQLSTRENDETVIRYGARPKAGDMAFVLGTAIANDSGMVAKLFSGNALQSGNILTYKYYATDDIVIRAGLRFYNQNLTVKGTGLDSSAQYDPTQAVNLPPYNNLSDMKTKTVDRMYEIVPGVEKHFLASNIFDAYIGADLYLGFGSEKSTNNFNYKNGDKSLIQRKTNTTNVGVGLVSGFNVFIGNLPVSLGLEYGWNAKWTFGGLTKTKEDVTVGTTSYTQEYKQDNSATTGSSDAKYSKLKRREFNANTNQDVRVVLHIYFGK